MCQDVQDAKPALSNAALLQELELGSSEAGPSGKSGVIPGLDVEYKALGTTR